MVEKATAKERKLISDLVYQYSANKRLVETALSQLVTAVQSNEQLMGHVHSLKWRVKDADHLDDKLHRKLLKCKRNGVAFDIGKENLFSRINDLAGIRILHLHTTQIVDIDRALQRVFQEYRYQVIEGPEARTWDDEYREFYTSVKIGTVNSPKMYTSVHYVVSPNLATEVTCEIQVRTLAEELWGEVDHSMNYPKETDVAACRDQIRVLARVTSSCSRLVDAIYKTARDAESVPARSLAKKGSKK